MKIQPKSLQGRPQLEPATLRGGPGVRQSTRGGKCVIEVTRSPSVSVPVVRVPWDLISKVGVGSPLPDGSYASYKCKFWPGNFGGIVPGNMFTEFTVAGSGTVYLVVEATGTEGGISGATLAATSTHPDGQVETLGGPPASFGWVVGAFVDGTYFNIAKKNLVVGPRETFRETDPGANPYGLPYRSYFTWSVT